MQKTAGVKMAANTDSYTPFIAEMLVIFWTHVFHTELRLCPKSRRHFPFSYSDIENEWLLLNDLRLVRENSRILAAVGSRLTPSCRRLFLILLISVAESASND